MKNHQPYKLTPGSEEAQVIELLRFLPAGTALNARELRNRLGWSKSKGICQKLVVPTKRGALMAEKRFDEAAGCYRTHWQAVRPAAGGVR